MAITLSSGVRTNLQSLQGISDLLNTAQNRLATGKKVNSALDNPSSFFTAQNLSDRSTKLNGLLDGINNGVSTVKAASSGLDSIYKSLQTAQGIVDSVKADAAKAANQLRGTVTTLTSTLALDGGVPDLNFANNDEITFTDNVTGGQTVIDLGATAAADTVQDLIDKINAQGNGVYSASLNNGALTLTSTSSNAFTVSTTTAGSATAMLGATLASTVGTVDQGKINSYAKQFNDVLDSIDQFAADSSFNGVNLLKAGNDLTINYNEDGSSKSTVTSRDITAANFNLADINATGTGTVTDFTNKLQMLKDALSSVRQYQTEYASTLSIAQNRQSFSKSLSDILQTGADNLTNADQNQEAANVLALQTRQSLSQSALSLSVQADQAVLQLLR